LRRAAFFAAGKPAARPVAERERHQRDRQDAAPDVEADAEVGRHDARGKQLQRENRAAGDENDGLQQHALGAVGYNGGAFYAGRSARKFYFNR